MLYNAFHLARHPKTAHSHVGIYITVLLYMLPGHMRLSISLHLDLFRLILTLVAHGGESLYFAVCIDAINAQLKIAAINAIKS